MIVGVVGGNLQGVEAAYLARKAGWEVVVVDRHASVSASGLCDRFVQLDITPETVLGDALDGVDLILPALENRTALRCLDTWAIQKGVPFAFDSSAYDITASKERSNQLFACLNLPAPRSRIGGGFPVVAKPNSGSGSQGVVVLNNAKALQRHLYGSSGEWVIQEFLSGPIFSLEIMGKPGKYFPLQVTDLEMDTAYDCKRVCAPSRLAPSLVSMFEKTAVRLAVELKLKGLMDVEAVLHEGTLKLLEMDARLPSQTPITVYWSTGVNMVDVLGSLFIGGRFETPSQNNPPQAVVYEQIRVSPDCIETGGEHFMSGQGPLHVESGFFGADEAITDYAPGDRTWVAALIVCGENRKTVRKKRNRVIAGIQNRFKIAEYRDPVPPS